jgi:hypothetical protein
MRAPSACAGPRRRCAPPASTSPGGRCSSRRLPGARRESAREGGARRRCAVSTAPGGRASGGAGRGGARLLTGLGGQLVELARRDARVHACGGAWGSVVSARRTGAAGGAGRAAATVAAKGRTRTLDDLDGHARRVDELHVQADAQLGDARRDLFQLPGKGGGRARARGAGRKRGKRGGRAQASWSEARGGGRRRRRRRRPPTCTRSERPSRLTTNILLAAGCAGGGGKRRAVW